MTTIADGLKDVFLAGVGARALGAEKTQELVESLSPRARSPWSRARLSTPRC